MRPEQYIYTRRAQQWIRVDCDSGAAITAFREQQQGAVQNGNRRTDGKLQRSKNSRMSEWRTTFIGLMGSWPTYLVDASTNATFETQWFAH